jgi:glycosyltransferase involved in cell wall biosynthesis
MTRPLVSVLLPTYNQARFLPDALAGLDAQTFRDFEVIACDDGSTDETGRAFVVATGGDASARSACAFALSRETTRGTRAAINTAAARPPADLLTWVSSDNIMHPDWLATLVDAMGPDVGAVYSAYTREQRRRSVVIHPGPYDPDRLISSPDCYFGPSFLIRREVWQEHRGLASHDYDNWAPRGGSLLGQGARHPLRRPGPVHLPRGAVVHGAVSRPELYDAPKWREEAMRRRAMVRA